MAMNLKQISAFFIILSVVFTTPTLGKWSLGRFGSDKEAIERRYPSRKQAPTKVDKKKKTRSQSTSRKSPIKRSRFRPMRRGTRSALNRPASRNAGKTRQQTRWQSMQRKKNSLRRSPVRQSNPRPMEGSGARSPLNVPPPRNVHGIRKGMNSPSNVHSIRRGFRAPGNVHATRRGFGSPGYR